MNPESANSLFPVHAAALGAVSRLAAAFLLTVALFTALPARGQVPITVPNFSFENPTTTFVSINIPSWQEPPQPANFNSNQGYTWADLAGVFANTPAGESDSITNINGNQAAWIFNDEGMALYQTLTNTYQVGTSYSMTVGIVGQGGGMVDGSIIQLQFYYLDVNSNMVVIATTTATENSANFPNHTMEYDYTVSIPAVKSTDPWANKPIGIQIISPEGSSSLLGGYWDVDNVRLNSFPPTVPTPGLPGLFACVGALLSLRGLARGLSRRAA